MTQRELALQMIQQLRVLDPSISAEIGTPERKIIDTVAQSLADNQIDLALLSSAFDLDSKFGSDLDKFLGIFGYGRQKGAAATGFVTFSRTTASNYDIPIPRGTQLIARNLTNENGDTLPDVTFFTTETVTLEQGDLTISAPIRCLIVGTTGNVAANTITAFGRSPTLGITDVTNEVATTGGVNAESDNEVKVRFKNTVFRNLAGTQDQFLALAVATQFTTKANVVGPISRYREYIQVPDVDDASVDPDSARDGNGASSEFSSALSTVPYSQHVYTTIPNFISTDNGVDSYFYREELDYVLNTDDAARDRGDAYRNRLEGTGDSALDTDNAYKPSVTFLYVYEGTDDSVQALRPGDIVLFEHSYMSQASRNQWDRQVLNCVDVYINGRNDTLASAIIPRPSGTTNVFNAGAGNRFNVDNYRRVGEPERRPVLGNLFSPLYWTPVSDLPDFIVTDDATFSKGVHYWPVVDVTELGGSVRSRCGIEWATGVKGAVGGDVGTAFTGPKITGVTADSVEINNYTYDRNVIDLQVAMESNKQVTSDVLAHQARLRYFKLDITVMYEPGRARSDVNTAINDSVKQFFDSLYFGSAIQLSDLLQAIHNTGGVDNVRWSRDILEYKALSQDTTSTTASNLDVDADGSERPRVIECDINGSPLLNVQIDRRVSGGAVAEQQQFYITGGEDGTLSGLGGTYTLSFGGATTAAIAYNATQSAVQSALAAVSIPSAGVTGAGTFDDPFIVTFSGSSSRDLITADVTALTGGTAVYNSDFWIQDNELPAVPTGVLDTDAAAGLIIRPRAQNTWSTL
jgi:uncharacterized phage protein gp47/JayE